MKTVLVTGAGGFIGGATVREFLQQGWRVLAMVRRTVPDWLAVRSAGGAGGITLLRADVTDSDSTRAALAAAGVPGVLPLEAIVHCAGRASDVGWRREFRKTNFEAVQHLVKLAKALAVSRFVFISTTDVYGLRDVGGEAEDALLLREYPRNPYPEFKILAEQWIRRELPKERYVILRVAQAWGVGDPTLTRRIVAFLSWSPWIVHFGKWRGGNRWPHAHVRNVGLAAWLAATSPAAAGLAINVADDERTSMDEWYRLMAEVYLPGKQFRSVVLPMWAGRLVGGAVSAVSNALNLAHPVIDPSFYALHAVSANLDFGNQRLQALSKEVGRRLITRQEGIRELREERSTGSLQ